MTHIPTSEIKLPDLHADTLGYTFLWQGHFLRGIFLESVELAKSYFETGFLDEVIAKEVFPKTWISEYENEQFGMILEHEMISPVLYATEWNSAMLKNAALMVLDIAEIGWRHGYNMIDCHKLNVMFKGTKPVYVDLGSFVLREKGMTGWHPYMNFMSSYYYILDIWSAGACKLAKRMMSPGVSLSRKEWSVYKYPINRHFCKLASFREKYVTYLCYLSSVSPQKLIKHLGTPPTSYKANFIKVLSKLVKTMKLAPSQHLASLRRKVSKMHIAKTSLSNGGDVNGEEIKNILSSLSESESVIFFNSPISKLLEICDKTERFKKIISIQEDDNVSNSEYDYVAHLDRKEITITSFFLLNGGFFVRGKSPEPRLSSDIAVILDYQLPLGQFGLHNAMVFFDRCKEFSRTGHLIVNIPHCSAESKQKLLANYFKESQGDTFVC